MKAKVVTYDTSGHEWVPGVMGGTLLMDRRPRGGLLLQVGIVRDGREEWNSIRIPRRFAREVEKFIRRGGSR